MITEDMHHHARDTALCGICPALCFALFLPLFVAALCIVASVALLILETIAYKAYQWSAERQQVYEARIESAMKHEVQTK